MLAYLVLLIPLIYSAPPNVRAVAPEHWIGNPQFNQDGIPVTKNLADSVCFLRSRGPLRNHEDSSVFIQNYVLTKSFLDTLGQWPKKPDFFEIKLGNQADFFQALDEIKSFVLLTLRQKALDSAEFLSYFKGSQKSLNENGTAYIKIWVPYTLHETLEHFLYGRYRVISSKGDKIPQNAYHYYLDQYRGLCRRINACGQADAQPVLGMNLDQAYATLVSLVRNLESIRTTYLNGSVTIAFQVQSLPLNMKNLYRRYFILIQGIGFLIVVAFLTGILIYQHKIFRRLGQK